jgi:hypothetical protein
MLKIGRRNGDGRWRIRRSEMLEDKEVRFFD